MHNFAHEKAYFRAFIASHQSSTSSEQPVINRPHLAWLERAGRPIRAVEQDHASSLSRATPLLTMPAEPRLLSLQRHRWQSTAVPGTRQGRRARGRGEAVPATRQGVKDKGTKGSSSRHSAAEEGKGRREVVPGTRQGGERGGGRVVEMWIEG